MPIPSRLWKIALIILLVCFSAGQIRPVSAGNNVWTSIGPDGGNIGAVLIDPHTPTTLYTIIAGGVLKSTNGGASWFVINNGLQQIILPFALTMDPLTPTSLYLLASDDYKTTDGGAHWTKIEHGSGTSSISRPANAFNSGGYGMLIDPTTPTTFYLHTYNGLRKSVNAGKDWYSIDTGLTGNGFRAMAIDPNFPSNLYVGSENSGGVFKSTRGGNIWKPAGLVSISVTDLEIDPTNSLTIYATTWGQGMMKSTDGAEHWIPINTGLTSFALLDLVMDPLTHTTLYAIAGDGVVMKSTNGGASWSVFSTPATSGFIQSLTINPRTPTTLYAGTSDRGLLKSTDGGSSWTEANKHLVNSMVSTIAIDQVTPATLYIGTDTTILKSTNSGASWVRASAGLPDPAFIKALVIDSHTPATLYAASELGMYKSTDSAGNWTAIKTGLPNGSGVSSLAIDQKTPTTLYIVAANDIYKTTNGGGNWSKVNTGLTYGFPRRVVVDPVTPTTVYAGVDAGGVIKSTNGGRTWTSAGLKNTSVHALAIDPVTPTTLYADVYGDTMNGPNHLYKSINGGASWTRLNTTILYDWMNAIVVDPARPSNIYAGSDCFGMFRSTNGGATWVPYNDGMDANTRIFALAIHPVNTSTVYAGTGGLGVYLIQKIPPLSINYPIGAPGSAFTITGAQFPANSPATISVNMRILGTVQTDAVGKFTFRLSTTPETDEGYYRVTASAALDASAMTEFILSSDASLRPEDGSGPVFDVPDGTAFLQLRIPMILR